MTSGNPAAKKPNSPRKAAQRPERDEARQEELISLLADGLSSADIAGILKIHRGTVWDRIQKLPLGAVEAERARRAATFDQARAEYITRANAIAFKIAEGKTKQVSEAQRDWLMFYTGRVDAPRSLTSAFIAEHATPLEPGTPADSTKIPAGAQVVIQYNGPGPALPVADVGREPQANDPDESRT